jgi:hypothetical protein
VTRYRYTIFGRPIGPWRATRREAEDDAEAAGDGERDDFGRFWITVPADIEVQDYQRRITAPDSPAR